MPRPRIPVVVLSGGLGSGKTTLLNHLLRTGRGRVGVIINDFGAVNVDALLVTGHVDSARSIADGCLCCLADTSQLDAALRGLAAPTLDLDAIVIEASGLAEPRQLARMVISSTVRQVRFGGVVEVVDAAAWAAGLSYAALPAPDHLAVASLVVLNKTDLATAPDVGRLEEAVRTLAPHAPTLRVEHGRVDPDLLYDRASRGERLGQLSLADELERHVHDHEHRVGHSAVSLDDPRPTDPGRLLRWLEGRPAGVYRVKGTTWFDLAGDRRRWVVQAVAGWVGFERGAWPRGQERRTRLVAIGAALDEDRVGQELEALLTDAGPLPEGAVTPLLRYAR